LTRKRETNESKEKSNEVKCSKRKQQKQKPTMAAEKTVTGFRDVHGRRQRLRKLSIEEAREMKMLAKVRVACAAAGFGRGGMMECVGSRARKAKEGGGKTYGVPRKFSSASPMRGWTRKCGGHLGRTAVLNVGGRMGLR